MRPESAGRLRSQMGAVALLATLALLGFLVTRRREVDVALHIYVVVVGGAAATALAASALTGVPTGGAPSLLARWRRRRRRLRPDRVRSLEELEHAVDFATTTAFDVHYRLRPHLVRIARHRLSARHGVLLEADPAAARDLLGERLWELVRPDREPPDQRNARGLPMAELRTAVDALEAL